MEQRNNYKWNWARFFSSMLRPERWCMVILLITMVRDNFKIEYEDKAWVIWALHLLGITICVFADVLKKRIDNSNFKVGNVEVTHDRSSS